MEYHLKKPNWQRGDLNLRRRYQSTAMLFAKPSTSWDGDGVMKISLTFYSFLFFSIIVVKNK